VDRAVLSGLTAAPKPRQEQKQPDTPEPEQVDDSILKDLTGESDREDAR
jgi:hypothetical protein